LHPSTFHLETASTFALETAFGRRATLAEKHGVPPALVHEIMREAADIILYDLAHASFWTHVWLSVRSMCGCCCAPLPSLREPRV
jgi:hypothetical protein